MTLSRRRFASYAAGLAAVLVLGACSGAGAAPAGPTSTAVTRAPAPTTSTDATKSSATVDPVLARIPAEARPETMDGAEAFATFFMNQVNVAFTRPDGEVLKGLFAVSCKVCAEMQESAVELQGSGQRHSGLSIEVTATTVRNFTKDSRTVLLWTTQHAVPVVDKRGDTVRTTRGAKGVFLATMTFHGQWRIDRLQVVK